MKVDFQILESQLSETEMALLMAINVTMNAAMLAGAPPNQLTAHLDQHADNFTKINQPKAAHIMAALSALVRNAQGQPWRK